MSISINTDKIMYHTGRLLRVAIHKACINIITSQPKQYFNILLKNSIFLAKFENNTSFSIRYRKRNLIQ